jgi:hypothetical protein
MKTVFVSIFLILLCASSTSSQWKQDGKLVNDESDHKVLKGFGAHLLVVKNPREFVEMWKRPETPHIDPAKKVGFDESLGIIVLFGGCQKDSKDVCNAEVDFTIQKPDGSILVERLNQPLWKEMAPPQKNIQLGRAIIALKTARSLPPGEYMVKAKVSDLNAEISFDLETKFLLK